MPSSKRITRDMLDEPEDKPLVFVGHPGGLRGTLHLRNRGEERITLRRALLGKPGEKDEETRIISIDSIRRLVLQPGQRQRVEVGLAIEPHTPPGEYEAVIDIGERQQSVVLHVTEQVQLSVSPAQLVVENHSGATLTKRVIFTNEGNVPLTFRGLDTVPLEREQLEHVAIQQAFNLPRAAETIDHYVGEILRQAQQIREETGALQVRSVQGTVEIQPGEVRAIDLEIQIPEGLDERTRYRGTMAIYTSDLEFVVVPAQSASPDAGAKSTRGKRSKKSSDE